MEYLDYIDGMVNSKHNKVTRKLFTDYLTNVMNSPLRFYELFKYRERKYGTFKHMPPYFRLHLKRCFENIDYAVLKDFVKLNGNTVIRDIIIVLHPCPHNITLSKLYKDILS